MFIVLWEMYLVILKNLRGRDGQDVFGFYSVVFMTEKMFGKRRLYLLCDRRCTGLVCFCFFPTININIGTVGYSFFECTTTPQDFSINANIGIIFFFCLKHNE